jgi:hypothetical protein
MLLAGGRASFEAFLPDSKTATTRLDGGSEVSVNWEDHPTEVLALTLRDKKNAGHGAARLPRERIDRANKSPGCAGALSYERQEVVGNPHHGNIVFKPGLEHVVARMIASALALESVVIQLPRGASRPA